MSKQEIASLACKILGIYMITQGINVMANVLTAYLFVPQQGFSNNTFMTIISSFIFLIIFGVLLWPLSDRLAAIMVKEGPHFREELGVTASDIQRVSFSVLGLLLFANSIPRLVPVLVSFYTMRGIPNSTANLFGSLGTAGIVTQLILGLGIFLGSQGLVNLLNAIRYAGLSRDTNSKDN